MVGYRWLACVEISPFSMDWSPGQPRLRSAPRRCSMSARSAASARSHRRTWPRSNRRSIGLPMRPRNCWPPLAPVGSRRRRYRPCVVPRSWPESQPGHAATTICNRCPSGGCGSATLSSCALFACPVDFAAPGDSPGSVVGCLNAERHHRTRSPGGSPLALVSSALPPCFVRPSPAAVACFRGFPNDT